MARHTSDEELLIDTVFDVVANEVGRMDYNIHMKLFEALSQLRPHTGGTTTAKALIIKELLAGIESSRQSFVAGKPYFQGFTGYKPGIEAAYAIGDLLRTHRPESRDAHFRSVCKDAIAAHWAAVDRIGEEDDELT